jgi:hypothetical protein
MNFTDISTYWPLLIVIFATKGHGLIAIKSIQIGSFRR